MDTIQSEVVIIIKEKIIEKIKKYLISKKLDFENIIRNNLRIFSPVRSGKLLDTMLVFLRLDVLNTTLKIATLKPLGYPDIISTPQHHGDKLGWADSFTPMNDIENVCIEEFGDGGQTLYLLNDPTAMGNYRDIIPEKAVPEIIGQMLADFPNYKAKVILPDGENQGIQVILTQEYESLDVFY